jgi:hypothetical protein
MSILDNAVISLAMLATTILPVWLAYKVIAFAYVRLASFKTARSDLDGKAQRWDARTQPCE